MMARLCFLTSVVYVRNAKNIWNQHNRENKCTNEAQTFLFQSNTQPKKSREYLLGERKLQFSLIKPTLTLP